MDNPINEYFRSGFYSSISGVTYYSGDSNYIETVKHKDNMNERKAKTKIIRKFNNDRMKYAKHLR
jgi:hypothetical protein